METNIQLEVPKTEENLTAEEAEQLQKEAEIIKEPFEESEIGNPQVASKTPLISPNTDPSVIVLSIIFLLVALILAGFLARERIMALFGRKKKLRQSNWRG